MKCFLILKITVLMIILSNQSIFAQNQKSYPLWKDIDAGSHNVGFKVINWRDNTRSLTGNDEEISGEDRFFPIQISIWYPTNERWNCEKAMPFVDYFYLTEQKNDFKEPTKERKEKAFDIFYNFAKFGLKIDLDKAKLKETADKCTASIKDAKPVGRQKFPVILAGHDGGVWKGSTLNEFLASHGYVVVSTGLLSETSRMFSNEPQKALLRRVRTFEITRGLLNEIESADQTKIGLLGINADGMSVLLYQMKNKEAKAVVSIDGWEGKNNGSRYVSENLYFKPSDFKVPLLEFHQDEKTDREPLQLNMSIFNKLTDSDRFSFILNDFGHPHLTGNMIALPELNEQAVKQHEFWYNTVRKFLDAYVKKDDTAMKFIWNEDNRFGLDSSFFKRAERIKSSENNNRN